MQAAGKHIIQKQMLDVVANGFDNGFALQQQVEQLWKENLAPRLEQLLDSYNTGGRIIRIDELYIDISAGSLADIEDKLITEIDRQLQQKIAGQSKEDIKTIARRDIELLVFYLQKGYLPWWSPVKTSDEWQQHLNKVLTTPLSNYDCYVITTAFKADAVRTRLITELTAPQFWQLVAAIAPKFSHIVMNDILLINSVLSDIIYTDGLNLAYKHAVLRSILAEADAGDMHTSVATYMAEVISALSQPVIAALSKAAIGNTQLKQVIEKRAVNLAAGEDVFKDIKPELPVNSGAKTADQSIEPKEKNNSIDEAAKPEDIYIANSGLVIVAPYLTTFFRQMQLTDKDKLTQTHKAVALLNYLVYGHTHLAGFECVLAKILCGLELSDVVKDHHLSDEEKHEADELLTAVINHWQVLKNTSVQGLRTSFLQREGRLSFANNEWRLKVQNEPYDVLLAHIPWNISMIKLSWMQHLLKVDWV